MGIKGLNKDSVVRLRTAPGSNRTSARSFALGLTAILAAVAIGSVAFAQAPPAVPATQPPAADAPAGGDAAQQPPKLIYSRWEKICKSAQQTNGHPYCYTAKDGRYESGMLAVSAALIDVAGEATKILRVQLPLGVLLRPGVRVIIDQGPPVAGQYVACRIGGCVAEYEASPELISQLRDGQGLFVQGKKLVNGVNQIVVMGLPLTDFAKAYDGAPTDEREFEDQQKQLQADLQKRAEEAHKKLETQHPAQ
jgi:invasion protein IalB